MKRIKFIVLSAVMLMTATSVFATEGVKFDPYASIRMFLGYQNQGAEVPSTVASANKQTDLVYRLQTNSRVGANFEVDNMKAVVEVGLSSTVNVRLANATFDFGVAKLTVGQGYTPYTWLAVGDYADDNNLAGFGASYDGRKPLISLNVSGAYVTLISESRTVGLGLVTTTDTQVLMPKTAVGYDYTDGATVIGAGAALNMVKIHDNITPAAKDFDGKTITSYLGYIHANVDLGSFVIRGNFAYGQNTGNFGLANVTSANTDSIVNNTSYSKFDAAAMAQSLTDTTTGIKSIKNTTTMEGYINPMFKVSPELMIGAGFGYAQAKNDTFKTTATQMCYFVDAKYSVTKQFSVMPEFSYRDYGKDTSSISGEKIGNEYYAGAQLQIKI